MSLLPSSSVVARVLALILVVALGGSPLAGCASQGPRSAKIGGDAPPDWMASGGNSPRYPRQKFLTGIASVDVGSAEGGVEAARQQAAGDLSRKIVNEIRATLVTVSESKDGQDSYEVQSIVNTTSDIALTGVEYEVWADEYKSHALAYLERGRAIRDRRALRGRALIRARECLKSGDEHLSAGREADALATYQSCRTPIAEASEQDAIARALGASSAADTQAYAELVDAKRSVEDKDRQILRSPASSLSEAMRRLGIKLDRQEALTAGRVVVSPFTYGTTDLSSEFGHQASVELESVLIRRGVGSREIGPRVVRGVYLERDADIRLTATVRDSTTGRLVASADATLPKAVVPTDVSVKPANFEQVLEEQRALGAAEVQSGDLQLEVWTDRGRHGVVYTEGEEMRVKFRVNQPAFVRFIYRLENGEKVLVHNAWKVHESQVNQVLTLPDYYEIVPPFGVEMLHATAFNEWPIPVVTDRTTISGVHYEIVREGEIPRLRGIAKRQRKQIAESLLTVTTVPR